MWTKKDDTIMALLVAVFTLLGLAAYIIIPKGVTEDMGDVAALVLIQDNNQHTNPDSSNRGDTTHPQKNPRPYDRPLGKKKPHGGTKHLPGFGDSSHKEVKPYGGEKHLPSSDRIIKKFGYSDDHVKKFYVPDVN